jgi:hypothetical protein
MASPNLIDVMNISGGKKMGILEKINKVAANYLDTMPHGKKDGGVGQVRDNARQTGGDENQAAKDYLSGKIDNKNKKVIKAADADKKVAELTKEKESSKKKVSAKEVRGKLYGSKE